MFQKIKDFFNRIFNKQKALPEGRGEITTIESEPKVNKFKSEELELLKLQDQYEKGMIAESELTEEQKSKLKALYNKQIQNLEANLAYYKFIIVI